MVIDTGTGSWKPVEPRTATQLIMGSMHDETLSRAVVTYIRGNRQQSWPSAHPDAVEEQFGDRAVDLIPRVEALISEIHDRAHEWLHVDLAITARGVEEALRQKHPELTAEAIQDLVAYFTYVWK
jgi:hypothetical protein